MANGTSSVFLEGQSPRRRQGTRTEREAATQADVVGWADAWLGNRMENAGGCRSRAMPGGRGHARQMQRIA